MSEGEVVTVRQVQTADVSITIDAYVADLHGMRPHVANQCRPHQKTVPIEFAAAAIVVVEHAGLNRVTLPDEVLPKQIGNVNILMPQIEAIQPAIRVLFELPKVSHVVLIAIIIK